MLHSNQKLADTQSSSRKHGEYVSTGKLCGGVPGTVSFIVRPKEHGTSDGFGKKKPVTKAIKVVGDTTSAFSENIETGNHN